MPKYNLWYRIKLFLKLDSPPVVDNLVNPDRDVYYPISSDNQLQMLVKDANNQGIKFLGFPFKITLDTNSPNARVVFRITPDRRIDIVNHTIEEEVLMDISYLDLSF